MRSGISERAAAIPETAQNVPGKSVSPKHSPPSVQPRCRSRHLSGRVVMGAAHKTQGLLAEKEAIEM